MKTDQYRRSTEEDVLTHVLLKQKQTSRLFSREENDVFQDRINQIESYPDFDPDSTNHKQKSIGIFNMKNSIYRQMVQESISKDDFLLLERRIYDEIEVKNRDFIRRVRNGEEKPKGSVRINKGVLSITLNKVKLSDAFTYVPDCSKRQRI